MKVMLREFQAADIALITRWMDARGKPAPPVHLLPETGLIIDNCACGFLIKTDCKVAILDYYMSNPSLSKELRDIALDEITHALASIAGRAGFLILKCDTEIGSVKHRAYKHGFKKLGEYSSFFKEL